MSIDRGNGDFSIESFGNLVRAAREMRGVSLDALAEVAGLDRSHLYKIESGRIRSPRQETRQRLLNALNLTQADLRANSALRDAASRPVDQAEASIPVSEPARMFYAYSHKDKDALEELREHLSPLRKQRRIQDWHDREIRPGQEWESEITERLETADIVVLLVSSSFVASGYAFDKEATRSLERHLAEEAIVIPVVVRAVDWHSTPLAMLQALPEDGRAVASWHDRDEAWVDVAKGIRKAVDDVQLRRTTTIISLQETANGDLQGKIPEPDDEPGMIDVFEDALSAVVDIWASLERLKELGDSFQRRIAEDQLAVPTGRANSPAAAVTAARAVATRTAATLNWLSDSMEVEIQLLRDSWSTLRSVYDRLGNTFLVDKGRNQESSQGLLAVVPGLQDQLPGVATGLAETRSELVKLRGLDRGLNRAITRCDRALQGMAETLAEGELIAAQLKRVMGNA